MQMPRPNNSHAIRHPRRSISAARSRAFELERLDRMSVEERIKVALTLDARFAWLAPKRREG